MADLVRPDNLHIEANASCQLRCPTCPTTSQGYPPVVGSGYLRFNDFKKLVDDNPQFWQVEFENRGELFLNPELLPIIEYGFKKNILMFASSGVNLNFVHEGVLEGLVQYNFRSLRCSIDGATPETYQIYRVGGDFERVIKHIQEINRYKQAYRSPYPELTWQFVVFGHNEHELPLAKEMAKKLNMEFSPKMSWDSAYSPIRNKEFVMAQTGWPAVTREEFEHITGHNYMRHICLALWNSPRVNWDGKILGCCRNSWGDFGGNAFQNGYIPAINNDKINYAREMLFGKVEPVKNIPCTTCELYQTMRTTGKYLTKNEIFQQHSLWYYVARFAYRWIPGFQRFRSFLQRRMPPNLSVRNPPVNLKIH